MIEYDVCVHESSGKSTPERSLSIYGVRIQLTIKHKEMYSLHEKVYWGHGK